MRIFYAIVSKKNIKRGLYGSILIFISVLFSNLIIINSTQKQLYDDINLIPKKNITLVLGCKKEGINGINPYFKNRMDAAIELYQADKTDRILVSGDNHSTNYDETTDMANYLIENGIPDSVIIKDYAGFRTFDSVVRAKKVFNCQELIIVSQKYHNQRAVFIANQFNINAVAYNCKGNPSTFNLNQIREYLAKFKVILDLFVLNTQPKFLGSSL